MRSFIIRTLSYRVTPLAYLVALQGLVYGVSFTFFSSSPGVTNTILFKNGAVVGVELWGIIALVSSLVLITGLLNKSGLATSLGALGMFLAWVFAAIVYLTGGYYYLLFPLAVVNILAHAYLYIAASMDKLFDRRPA
jgi:hypothetical protein